MTVSACTHSFPYSEPSRTCIRILSLSPVGEIDSGSFKGIEEMEALKRYVEDGLKKYVNLARNLGFRCGLSRGYRHGCGRDCHEPLRDCCKEYRQFHGICRSADLPEGRHVPAVSPQRDRLFHPAPASVGRYRHGDPAHQSHDVESYIEYLSI